MSEVKTPRRRIRNLQLPALPSLDDVLRVHALQVLDACQGNRRFAASVLGIDRKTLYRMLRRWGVPPP
jgi:transcriptional regulator of acetoin/glycerol metabolism